MDEPLMHADDICLMAPTAIALQKVLDVCYNGSHPITHVDDLFCFYFIVADRLHEYTSTKTRKEPNAETLAVLKQALHYEYDFYYFVRERFYRQYDTIKNKFKK